MQNIISESFNKALENKAKRTRRTAFLLALSLLVSLDVFWILRKPGLTLAGDADCGVIEHAHDESCQGEGKTCSLAEHSHSIQCYSDSNADTETQLQWQKMFDNYPYTGNLRNDLAGIAKTQVGYAESKVNFAVDSNGTRRGYTRYGDWYGAPYSDWSATFVSFCLHYAGANIDDFPISSGTSSMAEQWKRAGKYIPSGEYIPVVGDLVFFKNNKVGIVANVQTATFYVICGDIDDAVCGNILSFTDSSISGWGIMGDMPPNVETAPPIEQIKKDPQLNFNNPVFSIHTGDIPTGSRNVGIEKNDGNSESNDINLEKNDGGSENKDSDLGNKIHPLKTTKTGTTQPVTDLVSYLNSNGGSYFFTLLDIYNRELPQDENGNYIVISETGYKLTISFNSPEGFHPGTYEYRIPGGLVVDGGEGVFVLGDGTNVGNWTVTDEGVITMVFNDQINNHTDVIISASCGIHFHAQEGPLDFDGKISIIVESPPENAETTKITKWGIQGSEDTAGKTNSSKIYWNVNIVGNKDSHIPGSIISDKIIHGEWIGNQSYTQSDMAEGLRFGASDPDWNWHSWTVYPDDPNLTWTEAGWTYKMPETINCWCGKVTLGNEGWIYYIDYSSTPDQVDTAGTLYYMNRISVDNHYADGGTNFTHGEALGVVSKNGYLISDASEAYFLWEFQVTVPARQEGEKADYYWYLMDYMYLLDQESNLSGNVHNDANLSVVTATFGGKTINVPHVKNATENDQFAWCSSWAPVQNGITYGREISLLCRCTCDENNCQFGGTGCGEYWFEKDDGTWATNGFCQCWTVTDNVVFTFIYKTTDISIMEKYGGLSYSLHNYIELYHKPDGGANATLVSNSSATVPIPSLFKKELTHDFNGYTANYNITVNESKLTLTDGSPLRIHDVMTDTLAFISGSLVVNAEDVNGNITTLRQDVDYTVSYDGTGKQKDENGNKVHVLDIVILHPQPVKYILDYDATLIMPETVTEGVKYKNSASIHLWGQDIKDSSTEKVYADINISAKSFKVEINKTSATTNNPLKGAKFGLYNEHGGLITTATTDSKGKLIFQTNIIEGIILREHLLYYVQEIEAPSGYQLDTTKHYFCFCDQTDDSCENYKDITLDAEIIRVPYKQTGHIYISNLPLNYNLPDTGGRGVYPLILASVMLIVTPLVYIFIQRRKQKGGQVE